MTKYNVGQVLYVILKKENRVYPMLVIKEINEKTLDGEVTSYMVRGGQDPKSQILVTEIDGEIFDSAERVKETLIERVTANIDRLVDQAVKKAGEWYPNSFEAPADDPMTLLKKVPAPTAPKQPRGRKASTVVDELKAELSAEADDATIITLPDGRQAKVRSVKLPDSMS